MHPVLRSAMAAAAKLPLPGAIERCYADEDLGPLLRSEAFAAFREKYPEPAKKE